MLIAEPAGPVLYVEIAARNSIGAGVGLIAAALGAHCARPEDTAEEEGKPDANKVPHMGANCGTRLAALRLSNKLTGCQSCWT